LRRATLDQLLVERAAELGVVTHLGCRIEKLSRSADGWQLKIKEENCQAKVLIGADGRNSWVAQQLGLNRSAAIQGRSVGFQSRLRSTGMCQGQIQIHLFPGGYAGVVELGDGTITLGIAIDKRRLGRERGSDFVFQALAQNAHLKRIIDANDEAPELSSVYPVYFSKRRCVTAGALLVGDAARVSEPITGQGIYFAMRSGLLAAETIDMALRQKNFAVDSLARYERACRRAFRSRFALNSVLRFAVYRPALVNPLIRLFEKNEALLDSLVATVCTPSASGLTCQQ
jgi:flavin-dependent dehydrogenase